MFDVITFGSASQDILVKPKNLTVLKYDNEHALTEGVCFPLGSKLDVDDIQFTSGGGGTNTAATFALQGFKSAFVGSVGSDIASTNIINELKQLKIDTRFVVKKIQKPTNHSIIISSDMQDRTILAYRGAAELLEKNDIPWKKLKTKWMYLAPLTGLSCELFEDIVQFAHDQNIKVAVNPGMAQLSLPNFSEITKKIDVLILNQEEASFLTKIPYEQEKEIFARIDEKCSGIVVMTKGGEGVTVSDNKTMYEAKPPKDRLIVDTTGAGDSFGSGFVVEFIRSSGNIEKSIQFGMANSVGNLSQVGAKTGLLKKGQKFDGVNIEKRSTT